MKSLRWMVAVVMLVSAAFPADTTELRCSVRSVSGDVVNIGCEGGATARPGDRVRVGFEAPGVGFIALEGNWVVSLIGPGGEVQATPGAGPHGTAQVGHVALIESSAPTAAPTAPFAGSGPRAPVVSGAPSGPDRSTLPPFARKPWIGLRLEYAPDDSTSGQKIDALRPDGPASRAGIKAGDVILAADGVPTPNSSAFDRVIERFRVGTPVTLRLLRLPDVVEVAVTPELPNLDHPFVQTKIGYDFLKGQDVPVDEQRGVEWLEKAAAQGFGDAVAMLEDYGNSARGGGSAASGPAAGRGLPVFIAGHEEGNRPGWFELEPSVQQAVTMSGALAGRLPPDLWAYRNQVSSPDEVLRAIQPLGGGWVLWVEAKLKVTRFGLGQDRITIQCFDPSGHLQWTEEVKNISGSGKQSLKILSKKIPKKLRKKHGEPCLRP